MTEWRAVAGYDGFYEVSDDGQVRSVDRRIQLGRPPTGRQRKLTLRRGQPIAVHPDAQGYRTVQLNRGGRYKFEFVHRLVAGAFIGPCPDGHEVNHKNGVKHDNRFENLEYATPQQNVLHRYRVLGIRRGNENPRRKLCEAQIPTIRALIQSGTTYKEVARRFNVSEGAIVNIMNGRSWSHVP